MGRSIAFSVYGVPAPQGSKKGFIGKPSPVTGKPRVILVESSASKVTNWRQDVTKAAIEAMGGQPLFDGPLELIINFYMPTPKSRIGQRFCTTTPDKSKLLRATEDALTGFAITDDARIVRGHQTKEYCVWHERAPGAYILLIELAAPGKPAPGKRKRG